MQVFHEDYMVFFFSIIFEQVEYVPHASVAVAVLPILAGSLVFFFSAFWPGRASERACLVPCAVRRHDRTGFRNRQSFRECSIGSPLYCTCRLTVIRTAVHVVHTPVVLFIELQTEVCKYIYFFLQAAVSSESFVESRLCKLQAVLCACVRCFDLAHHNGLLSA